MSSAYVDSGYPKSHVPIWKFIHNFIVIEIKEIHNPSHFLIS